MLSYFTDPLHSASIWGSILMCLSSSLIGVIAFLRRESLIGETLSHAAFPGVVIGIVVGGSFKSLGDSGQLFCQMGFAFLFSCLGIILLNFMKRSLAIKEDAALCFVLSTFVGAGVFLASIIQHAHPLWYKEVQLFFYGQAATMRDIHVKIYSALALLSVLFIGFSIPILRMTLFDPAYARSLGARVKRIDYGLIVLISIAVIIGIKAVGIVLMSGMLIAPAVFARAFSNNFKRVLLIAALASIFSGAFGHILASEIPLLLLKKGQRAFSLPSGPLILILAATLSFFALLFAPKQGIIYRTIAQQLFKWQTKEENFIKAFWKSGLYNLYSDQEIESQANLPRWLSYFFLQGLVRKEEIIRLKEGWQLTAKGRDRAQRIVRIHRLFELYLSSKLNMSETDVHDIAEEMEHYITPEMEQELTHLLKDPKSDPHSQPIPGRPNL